MAAKAVREAAGNEGDDDDEDESDYDGDDESIEEAAKEYTELLEEYDQKIIKKGEVLLSQLEIKYKKSSTTKEMKKKIAQRMKALGKIVGKLASSRKNDVEIHKSYMSGEIITKIKGIVSPSLAKDILTVFVRSKELGKVCKGRRCGRGKKSYKQATNVIDKRVARFEKRDEGGWLDHEAAHNGYSAPLKYKAKERNRRQKRLARHLYSFKKNEARAYNKKCGSRNYNSMECHIFTNKMK